MNEVLARNIRMLLKKRREEEHLAEKDRSSETGSSICGKNLYCWFSVSRIVELIPAA
jgi:hypothetical protein